MKNSLIVLALAGLATFIFPQQVFRAGIEGIALQGFSATRAISGFSVSGPDQEGYVYLVAHAGEKWEEVIRTRLEGCGFRGFTFPPGEYLSGFDVEGPDQEGYAYLKAIGNNGSCGVILRTRLPGSAVKAYLPESDEPICALTISGPDDEGYVYLRAGTLDAHGDETSVERTGPLEFSLDAVTSPLTSNARLTYALGNSCRVRIRIFDPSGRLVGTLVDSEQSAGSHNLLWNGTDDTGRKVNAGVYFLTVNAGEFTTTQKLVMVK